MLSPVAQQILNFVQKEMDIDRMRSCLDTLPFTNSTWDDLINVAVQLRLNKQWDAIIKVYPLIFLYENGPFGILSFSYSLDMLTLMMIYLMMFLDQ